MSMHPTTANEVARLRSEEKVARGLAAYKALSAQSESVTAEEKQGAARLRERPWQALSLSVGNALIGVLDRRRG